MQLSGVLILGSLGLLAATATTAAADKVNRVRDAYQFLRDGGCKASEIGSPIVARVLRNVPYALRGKIFKSPELTYLFEHDGGWYTGTDKSADVAAEDRACVRALDKQEKVLRKRAKIQPAIEAAISRHPEAVVDMLQIGPTDYTKVNQSQKTEDGNRIWGLWFESRGDLIFTVRCTLPEAEAKAKAPDWSKLDCNTLVSG